MALAGVPALTESFSEAEDPCAPAFAAATRCCVGSSYDDSTRALVAALRSNHAIIRFGFVADRAASELT
jgi:hypothetical protein